MQRVLIIGAGGHAQVVVDILQHEHEQGIPVVPVGYVDDNPALHQQQLLGLPVFGSIADRTQVDYEAIIVAIGDNASRKNIASQLQSEGERFASARHPAAVIAPDVYIGDGSMICAGVVVNPCSVIGNHTILNTGCTLDHHNRVDDYAHIAPGVHTGGEVFIGEGTLVGIGATIAPRCKAGTWSTIGAGAVVLSDVPEYAVAVGIPARSIKRYCWQTPR